jgi:hypothetical protein
MAENASEGREDKHVCGASGFGFAADDVCPACESYSARRTREIEKRLPGEILSFEVLILIAQRAVCSVPDVEKFLKKILPTP